MTQSSIRQALVAIAALGAGACVGMPSTPPTPALNSVASPDVVAEATSEAVTASPAPAASATTARAVELLAAGKDAEAKTVLQAVLAAAPRDASAQNFLRQIETDPVALLGAPSSETYVVQPGDTMSELAARFLGDGRMFFALSRYNGLAAPNALSAGRVLKLPTSARRAATPSVATRARAADAARANEVRLQALQLLNTGEVDRAVALLREAASLDATDPAIRKDLERAERIQGALTDG